MTQRRPLALLTAALVERIAAGEALERPSSAVKELIENALDAGASDATIDIAGGGLDFLRVADDGEGIAPDDIERVCLRHTTSKIAVADDLDGVATFGFRGEALASLVAVADVTLVSSDNDDGRARQVTYVGGQLVNVASVSRRRGTTVVARSLFAQMPGRRKFLGSAAGETSRVAQLVRRYALTHPANRFSLSVEARLVLRTTGSDLFGATASECWGSGVRASLLPLPNVERNNISVRGWVTDREATRPTRTGIVLAVNGRPVQSPRLQEAIERGYRPLLPRGRHPFMVVLLSCDPAEVDPNVHPAKSEVLLRQEELAAVLVSDAVRAALSDSPTRPDANTASRLQPRLAIPWERPGTPRTRESSPGYEASSEENNRRRRWIDGLPRMRLIGQVRRCLIAVESDDALLLIDQHRAHERVLYERLRATAGQAAAQSLLEPLVLELKSHEADQMRARIGQLRAAGFQIEHAGGFTFLVQSVPVVMGGDATLNMDDDLVQDMALPGDGWRDRLFTSIACRTAVRRGRDLDPPFIHQLLLDLAATESPAVCPHGSPLVLEVTGRFLERQFDWT